MVNYSLRDDLKNLTVCLYNPDEGIDEWQFTTESLQNYINACDFQIRLGEPVKRFPFHVTASLADAQRCIENMKSTLQQLRREQHCATASPDTETDKPRSWGYSGGYKSSS